MKKTPETVRRIRILGSPVDMVSADEAMTTFAELMETEGCSQIVTPNSEILWSASKDPVLKAIISGAELVLPDGIGLVYASRLLGVPLRERVTGIDFLSRILAWLSENGKSVYFLGSAPGVAEKAAENMRARFPALKTAGTRNGYFGPEEEAGIVAEINASGADFLCVAMGSPRQERFISAHKAEFTARLAIGVGGSLDIWAGTLKRAPLFFRKHGIEWLYRLAQQPRRIGRMAVLPLFMLRVLFYAPGGKKREGT
ncbi:MAG: WecB/TagA/CpsF family glycosyltransferase [Clostridiales Family XIII bacterium]|jgi:N-acetylglucosaminyldiphosphoundecaprenol N-acetyl-beta-D-mannosaminyltransferase|nr:WecB/TagA/CpsF family glycosyltransferase [Clostridiales Family XIII bacterium]